MHILLAEDDKNFGQVLKKELEEERYSIDLVPDGLQAVLGFIDKPYDLVLLDIAMPKLDGINALRIIKKISPHVPVIAFSGNAGAEKMQEAIQNGAMNCLTKPFKIDKLKELIPGSRSYSPDHLQKIRSEVTDKSDYVSIDILSRFRPFSLSPYTKYLAISL